MIIIYYDNILNQLKFALLMVIAKGYQMLITLDEAHAQYTRFINLLLTSHICSELKKPTFEMWINRLLQLNYRII